MVAHLHVHVLPCLYSVLPGPLSDLVHRHTSLCVVEGLFHPQIFKSFSGGIVSYGGLSQYAL